MKEIGILLLAIWLILQGLQDAIGLSFRNDDVIYGVLAILAGVLLLIKR